MTLIRWNPSRDLMDVEREFGKLFNSFNRRFGFDDSDSNNEELENAVWSPLTDISENKDQYLLKMDLPGVTKNDLKLSYEDGELKISGERKQQKDDKDSKFHRIERTYGKYFRSFTLPKQIMPENIKAEFKDGQLTVTIPKAEEAKPKELEIKVN
ncbi:MAG TPA: Hsp20/alpha crystallin family protein [Ignavibacteriaceae bacterium]|nr:Hsp20/alpha crystallin family protein [Ignavibacteriaceae bacterium]